MRFLIRISKKKDGLIRKEEIVQEDEYCELLGLQE